jgi:hypothetical protein
MFHSGIRILDGFVHGIRIMDDMVVFMDTDQDEMVFHEIRIRDWIGFSFWILDRIFIVGTGLVFHFWTSDLFFIGQLNEFFKGHCFGFCRIWILKTWDI